MPIILGIDGGGTKTSAVIIDENGAELGRGFGGPCNIATCDDETLRLSVDAAVQGAVKAARLPKDLTFTAVCAGAAGYTAKKRRAEFLELLKQLIPADSHRLEPDYVIAYWGATEGEPGIIVSAGTGTVVFGRNEKGETWREDGNGFLLGDKGSAFYIARWALYRTLRNLRSGGELNEFDRRLLSAIGAEDADDLIEWTYRGFSPARIAELAKDVCIWAEQNVPFARRHLDGAADILHTETIMVADRLGMPFATAPIYLCGGLWQNSTYLRARFQSGHSNPRAPAEPAEPTISNICEPKHEPAFGAAFLALKEQAKHA